MASFEIKMWWAVLFTGLILIGLAVAAKKQSWGLVTALSGFLLAGLFAVMMECMWWIAE
jgi:hypothetical protein